MCPKSVWSGPVSSGQYTSLRAVWWKRIQATGVWSQWSAVLTFPVSRSGVWNSVNSNTLNSSSSQVPCDRSLAVIFLASSAVCGSNLDVSVSFVKASHIAVSISSPTGSSVSGFLALPLVVFLSSGREILSWKAVFPFECSFVLSFWLASCLKYSVTVSILPAPKSIVVILVPVSLSVSTGQSDLSGINFVLRGRLWIGVSVRFASSNCHESVW